MDGKLNQNGMLMIKRGGDFSMVGCPFKFHYVFQWFGWFRPRKNKRSIMPVCGDRCALFGEPELYPACSEDKLSYYTIIEACHKKLVFNTFIDEREEVRG